MSSGPTSRLRRGWEYYRRYTTQRTGVHAGATAALTVLGLLAYFERWFVAVAIVAYVVPPVYLYLSGDDLADRDSPRRDRDEASPRTPNEARTVQGKHSTDGDSDGFDGDSDSDDGDTDSDSDDGDTDSDSDDGDTDSDSDDGDTDSDTDSDG